MRRRTHIPNALVVLLSIVAALVAGAQSMSAAAQFQTIFDFPPAGSFAGFPGPPVIGPNGAIFGATIDSGPSSYGTVFELSPPSTAGEMWTQTVIHTFTGTPNEGKPTSLVLGPSGALYVLTVIGPTNTEGFVYQFSPPTAVGETGRRRCFITLESWQVIPRFPI